MIYGKGSFVKYEATEAGRERAAKLVAAFPASTRLVLKVPHHVELLVDFEFAPKLPETPQELARRTNFRGLGSARVGALIALTFVFMSAAGVAAGMGNPLPPSVPGEMILGRIGPVAAAIPEPSGKELLTFLGCILAVLGIYATGLTVYEKHRKAFARTPSMDEEITALRKSLSGLAPSEKVDKLVERLAEAATKKEVADVLTMVTAMIEKEVGQHRADVHNQLTDMRAYLHTSVHEIGAKLQHLTSGGELREQRLGDKIDEKFSEAIKASNSSASKVHGRIDDLAEVQGQLVGEVRHIAESSREAAAAAHAAAIAAAKAGAVAEALSRKGGRA